MLMKCTCNKKTMIASIVVFIAWQVMDFALHGVLLKDIYASTAHLWRPMEEMSRALMMLSTFFYSLIFVHFYATYAKELSWRSGMTFGTWTGLLAGIGMGSSYIWMPISEILALSWFFGGLVEGMLAGMLAGLTVASVK